MNIIKNTKLNRSRIKIMTKYLLPEYNYVRVKKSGVVILKKNWYSLKRSLTLTTDLILDILPKEISKRISPRGETSMISDAFVDEIYVLLRVKDYHREVDVVKTLWTNFNSLCRNVPTITLIETQVLSLERPKAWLPTLSSMSTCNLPNLDKIINYTNGDSTVDTLLSKFGNILKRQQLRSRCALPEWHIASMNFAGA